MTHAMTGGGDYDAHSSYQMRGGLSHEAAVADAVANLPLGQGRNSIVIADYGCAQGRVSNPLIRRAVQGIRERGSDVAVFVYHDDVLENDWATLFQNLRGEDSYVHVPGGPIVPLAAATSFYTRVVPYGGLDLGLSFAALQWLAAPGPPGTGSALYFDQLEGDARAEIGDRADRDWTCFLALRAHELAPGGRLVLDMMGRPEDGPCTGHRLWQMIRGVCEELCDSGRIDEHRLDGYVFPVYERTIAEAQRPFDSDDIRERIHLDDIHMYSVPNPFVDRYREDGDTSAFAAGFTGFARAFSEPSLRAGLGLDDATVDALYSRVESRLRDLAGQIEFEIHALTVLARRID